MEERLKLAGGLLCLLPLMVWAAAPPAEYQVSFDNAVHHEARIALTYREVPGEALELRMARSSPGRYAIHEFAKNVYDVSAENGAGEALHIERSDPYAWRVSGHDGTVTVRYTLYANRGDGTYAQIDTSHAHLNMPAAFMWARGLEERPVVVTFQPVDRRWKAATQLQPTDSPMTFRAPDLAYFMDSPTELSDFSLRTWSVEHNGERATIRLAVHHRGNDQDMDTFAAKAQKVVAEQIRLFDDVPDFDFGDYLFIADYLPQVSRDGMEHRNSTVLTHPESLFQEDFEQLGTLSHEFLHAWNVERLRPAELEPFDFTSTNPSPSLWFAEGFTSYYGPLTIRRAGESDIDAYLEDLSEALDAVIRGTGRRFASPQEMSLRAPFVDAATAIDPTNTPNTFVSYYTYGAVVALALDLTLRRQFENVTLDDYMRAMWRAHGVSQAPYQPRDLEEALAALTGDAAFAREFFADHVERSTLPDFAPLLEQAGVELRLKNPGKASLGRITWRTGGRSVVVDSITRIGEPLYQAGLDRGDEILSIGRFDIAEQADIEAALERHEPGDELTVRYRRRGDAGEATVKLAEDGTLEVVRYESADLEPSAEQLDFRAAWLGPDRGS